MLQHLNYFWHLCSKRRTFVKGNVSWTECRFSGNAAGDSSVPVGGNGGAIYTTASGGDNGLGLKHLTLNPLP
jgi:hypothetical protein